MRTIASRATFVLWLSLALGLGGAVASSARAHVVDTDREDLAQEEDLTLEIEALIVQLGDKLYVDREAASERLLKLGAPAIRPLEAVLKGKDAEIRYRAERLLTILRRQNLQARLDAFEQSGGRSAGEPLPGWERYRELAGNTSASRALFIAMQRAEPELLQAYQTDLAEASGILQVHCAYYEQALNNLQEHQEKNLSTSSLATLLLLAGDPRIAISDQSDSHVYWLMWWRMYRERVVESIQPQEKSLLVALFGGWIGRPTDPTSPICFEKIRMALRYRRKEVLPLCVELLHQQDPVLQSLALIAIGGLGNHTHVKHVEPLLANRQVFNRDKKIEIQLRDVALAVLVHLSGQELSDYGYKHFARNRDGLFVPGSQDSFFFDDFHQRDEALAKWQVWADAERMIPKDRELFTPREGTN